MVPTGESGSEHENGGFRGVKIREEGVDKLKLEARVDENVIFALGLASPSVIF